MKRSKKDYQNEDLEHLLIDHMMSFFQIDNQAIKYLGGFLALKKDKTLSLRAPNQIFLLLKASLKEDKRVKELVFRNQNQKFKLLDGALKKVRRVRTLVWRNQNFKPLVEVQCLNEDVTIKILTLITQNQTWDRHKEALKTSIERKMKMPE